MVSRNPLLLILIPFLLGVGCGVRPAGLATATATATIANTTIPSTHPPIPSDTPPPHPPQPTPPPVEGTTSFQVNVRAEPSTASSVLGMIPPNTKVSILGKDPDGNWWQIVYPQGADGKGWVTAQYVTAANGTSIPVVGSGTGGVDPNSANSAVVQQQLNVRSGPGTGFNSLGTLNARDVVRLTGKDSAGTWLQIEFPQGVDGKGWVNAAFVQARGVETLPIVTEAGEVVGTGTPTGIPFTPTPTVVPAWADNDSQGHPVASVVFEPLGTQTLIYNGDVSSPEGDSQDWIQFTSHEDTVFASLQCSAESNLQVAILENGQAAPFGLVCGEHIKPIGVKAGSVYLIHLQAPQSLEGIQYIPYTIKVQTSP